MDTKSILFTVSGVGIVSGVAGGGYYLFKPTNEVPPKNIKEKLIKEKLTPLDTKGTENTAKWTALIKKYTAKTSPVNDNKKVSGLSFSENAFSNPTEEDITALKNKCNTLFEKPITQEASFNTDWQNTKDWCTSESEFSK